MHSQSGEDAAQNLRPHPWSRKQRRHQFRRRSCADARFPDRPARAAEHGLAHGPDEIRSAFHDGRWRRSGRQHRVRYRLHRIQRPFRLRRDQGIPDWFYAVARAGSGSNGDQGECGRARVYRHGHDEQPERRGAAADYPAQRAPSAPGYRGCGERGGVPAQRQSEKHYWNRDYGRRGQYGMNNTQTRASANDSAAKAWLRAIKATAPIIESPHRILHHHIEELAARRGDAPAVLSDRECVSYAELAERSNRYARWALAEGLAKGETVCLLMPNRPEYLAIWLGITRIGGVVALLNTNLTGPSLANSIDIVAPKHVIAASELVDALAAALPELRSRPAIWVHGDSSKSYRRIDLELEQRSGERLHESELRRVSVEDRALYIYTSGTTGLPKAANVSHARILQWSHWFAGMMNACPSDRIYDCLPMYHSVGGIVAPGAMLVS